MLRACVRVRACACVCVRARARACVTTYIYVYKNATPYRSQETYTETPNNAEHKTRHVNTTSIQFIKYHTKTREQKNKTRIKNLTVWSIWYIYFCVACSDVGTCTDSLYIYNIYKSTKKRSIAKCENPGTEKLLEDKQTRFVHTN